MFIPKLYYTIKSIIPRRLQIILRQQLILRKRELYSGIWPIDEQATEPLDGWPGWPEKKQFALVLTHDVETGVGQEKCERLIRLEKGLGVRSAFYFVPKRYEVSCGLRCCLRSEGFEVGVHGLYHDGRLYESRKIFQRRATQINRYLREWDAVGFRSPSMHRNLEWLRELDIEYDASTFDTDPFEPYPDGVRTIFPFWVRGNYTRRGYVELPYTLPQDFTLFVLMKQTNVKVWKQKVDWIARNGGMALLNTHPDYMNFGEKRRSIEEYPVDYYVEFLEYVRFKYEQQYFHLLPRQVAKLWAENCNYGLRHDFSGPLRASEKPF
jgi:hypothetical protein